MIGEPKMPLTEEVKKTEQEGLSEERKKV